MIPKICRRSPITLLLGVLIGFLLSPIMWIQLNDPMGLVLNSDCDNSRVASKKNLDFRIHNEDILKSLAENITPSQDYNDEPFNMYAHNKSKLTWGDSVLSPGDPNIRYRKLARELAPRKLLFVGVVTAAKYLDTRALGIHQTWGKELHDLYFFSSKPNDSSLNLPIVTLPGIDDNQYPPQRKVYKMLKYMHDNYIDEFDFFMRSDDDVYVKTDLLLELLETINPAQDIYMGCPGFGKTKDRERIKLEEHEHYCMGGPGVIFSRSALRKLAPHLDTCLESVVVSYNEDVEVGRCVSRMLQLQCTWSWEMTIIFWTDYKKVLATSDMYTDDRIKRAITLHPLKDPKLMHKMHQYALELRLKRTIQHASVIQGAIAGITRLMNKNMSHFTSNKWLWYNLGSNPKSRYEIATWNHFNSTRLFLAYEHQPVVGLPDSLKIGINNALEVLLEIMNEREGNVRPFVPPYHLYDGFTVTDHSSGVEYILHMSVHRQGQPAAMEYTADIFLPFQGAGMVTYQEAGKLFQTTVNIIISIGQSTPMNDFLTMYEDVCLRPKLNTHLHIVIFGENENVKTKVNQLLSRYSQQQITMYQIRGKKFSYSAGYTHVVEKLHEEALVVFFDQNFVFTAEFLTHCLMNTIRGRQAYFPVLFSFYKQDLVNKFTQHDVQMLISADTGFFLRYNYQVASIYKSDFDVIGGFESLHQGGKPQFNDDVRFVDKVLSTDIYVMRALEPYLRRYYKPRTCQGLSSNARSACMNSRADAIGSKKILGSLLVSHDLLDKV